MFQTDILEKCKANDPKAQMHLYRQYCEGMFCVAMRFLKNSDDAEDVMQESFLKAFQKLEQYRGDVTFGAWLKRIVINKSIDFLKSRKERTEALDERYLYIAEDTDWTVEEGIPIGRIREAIDALPEKYRYVVMMYLIEGLDHGEISQVLDLAETTCRTRLLRGKGLLKESLKQYEYGTRS